MHHLEALGNKYMDLYEFIPQDPVVWKPINLIQN